MKKKENIVSQSQMVAIKNGISGELETAKVTISIQKDLPKYKDPFTILFQGVNKAMVRDMSPAASRLLLFCLSIVEYGNIIPMGIQQMADELGYSKRQCERGMDELIVFKIIIKQQHPTDKRMINYFVNPLQSWKGGVKDRKIRISETKIEQLDLFSSLSDENVHKSQFTLIGERYVDSKKSRNKKLEPSKDFE